MMPSRSLVRMASSEPSMIAARYAAASAVARPALESSMESEPTGAQESRRSRSGQTGAECRSAPASRPVRDLPEGRIGSLGGRCDGEATAASGPGRVAGDGDQGLAEVTSLEHGAKGARRRVEPLPDVLAVLDAAVADPLRHAIEERLLVVCHEVAHPELVDFDRMTREDRCTPRLPRLARITPVGRAVLRDQAAERDARAPVQERQHGFVSAAADVLEVDV